ncbi:MAG: biotin--[acetyl-CoA-carboxylase] ligase [Bacteroidales bacterium]|nr:biotin--[acetyl-CoA-carboxylase] ligase [Bacteroidales bacterium]
MRIFHEPDLSSTNTVLKARIEARQYRRFPMALTAETQTAGRGVGRNVWCSDKGANALFSLAFRPTFLLAEHQFLLNMALSLSMLHTLDVWARGRRLPSACFHLKWPNDLYVNEKKLGGILFEISVMGNRCAWAVMGVGVNVNQRVFPPELPNPAALCTLTDAAAPIDMAALRQAFIRRAARDYRRLERRLRHHTSAALLPRYKAAYFKRLLFFGQERTYICMGERMRARLTGVDDYGQAVVEAADGRRFSCGLKELQYVFGS